MGRKMLLEESERLPNGRGCRSEDAMEFKLVGNPADSLARRVRADG